MLGDAREPHATFLSEALESLGKAPPELMNDTPTLPLPPATFSMTCSSSRAKIGVHGSGTQLVTLTPKASLSRPMTPQGAVTVFESPAAAPSSSGSVSPATDSQLPLAESTAAPVQAPGPPEALSTAAPNSSRHPGPIIGDRQPLQPSRLEGLLGLRIRSSMLGGTATDFERLNGITAAEVKREILTDRAERQGPMSPRWRSQGRVAPFSHDTHSAEGDEASSDTASQAGSQEDRQSVVLVVPPTRLESLLGMRMRGPLGTARGAESFCRAQQAEKMGIAAPPERTLSREAQPIGSVPSELEEVS